MSENQTPQSVRTPAARRAPAFATDLPDGLQRRWLQALYETPLFFSGVLDATGAVLDGNRHAIEGCGLTRAEVIGRPFWECGWWRPGDVGETLADEVSSAVHGWCIEAWETGQPLRRTCTYFVRGTRRTVDLVLQALPDAPDAPGCLVVSGSDVTEAATVAEEREEQVAHEISSLRTAEARAELRLRRLAGVALELVNAESIEDLTEIVVNLGMPVLGADGGAILVGGGVDLQVAVSDRLGEHVQRRYGRIANDSPLPAAQVWRTGERLVLGSRQAGLRFPSMARMYADTHRDAWVVVPLRVTDRVLGSLSVSWVEAREISHDELALIEAFAAQCAQALQRILSTTAERAAAARVKVMAETLQRSLLTDPPQPDHLQIAVRYQPASEEAQVGGDWYDAFLVRDGGTSLVIGDVAGHDQQAAAAMGQVRNLLRGIAYSVAKPPGQVLSELDAAMRDLAVGSLATAVLARVEQLDDQQASDLRRLRWSNAGHPPPLLIDDDGTATLLTTTPDLLLGLDPETSRSDHLQELRPGCTVLLYTDGLVERRGVDIEEGLAWLVEAGSRLGGLTLEPLCDALLDAVPADAEDDIALIAIRAHSETTSRPAVAGPEVLPDGWTASGS